MVTPPSPPILFYPMNTYWDYLSRTETNTFCGRYAAVLAMHSTDPASATATTAPANMAWLIYAASQEGITTKFLLWHQGARGRDAQIVLLHSVSKYTSMMGLTLPYWYDRSFASNGDIACGTIACANWLPESIHQI